MSENDLTPIDVPFEFKTTHFKPRDGGMDIVFVFHRPTFKNEVGDMVEWETQEVSLTDFVDARVK